MFAGRPARTEIRGPVDRRRRPGYNFRPMEGPTDATRLLAECRQRFGAPPRRLGLFARWGYLAPPRPDWLKGDPAFAPLTRGWSALLGEGRVVWGRSVQVNFTLFEPGLVDNPGDFVFCPDPEREADPEELARVSRAVHRLHKKPPGNEEERILAEHLPNWTDRAFGLEVPASLSPEFPAELSTVLLVRRHLPLGWLAHGLLPLVVSPGRPRLATVLPERYWPDDLIRFWRRWAEA